MKIYNMMTCENLGTDFLSGCSMAWMGLVILFFFCAIIRRWVGEEAGVPFEFWFALIGGIIADVILISFTGSFKLALGAGIVVSAAVGFGLPYITGGGSGGEDYS